MEKSNSYYCILCGIGFSKAEDYRAHILTDEHAKGLAYTEQVRGGLITREQFMEKYGEGALAPSGEEPHVTTSRTPV